jgi:hypothetical protein
MKRQSTHFVPVSDTSHRNLSTNEHREGHAAVSPREFVIQNLLNYSKALSVLKTRDSGIVNLVMN